MSSVRPPALFFDSQMLLLIALVLPVALPDDESTDPVGVPPIGPCPCCEGEPDAAGPRDWGNLVSTQLDIVLLEDGQCQLFPLAPDVVCLGTSPCQFQINWSYDQGSCGGGFASVGGTAEGPDGTQVPRNRNLPHLTSSGSWSLGLPCGWAYVGHIELVDLDCPTGGLTGASAPVMNPIGVCLPCGEECPQPEVE